MQSKIPRLANLTDLGFARRLNRKTAVHKKTWWDDKIDKMKSLCLQDTLPVIFKCNKKLSSIVLALLKPLETVTFDLNPRDINKVGDRKRFPCMPPKNRSCSSPEKDIPLLDEFIDSLRPSENIWQFPAVFTLPRKFHFELPDCYWVIRVKRLLLHSLVFLPFFCSD